MVSVLLLFGLGHVRWAELKERREMANIPLIELVSVASKGLRRQINYWQCPLDVFQLILIDIC